MSGASVREIDRIASEWLAHRDSGNWSGEDEARLEEWLSASAVNRVAFLRLELAWEEMGRLEALAAGIRSEVPPPPGQWNLSPFFDVSTNERARSAAEDSPRVAETERARTGRKRWAIAAGLLIAIVAGSGGWYLRSSSGAYSTPLGGMESVPMLDGSMVTLNTNSQIRVALTRAERRVDLTQGEAFFEVAKESARPFVVEAGKRRIVAVGTKFAVRRDGDDIQVVVTEGKVRVEDASGADGAVFLTPGVVARIGEAGVLVQRKTVSEAEAELSWRNGILTFRDETLADAIAEFNRYSERKVAISDSAAAGLKIEGNFRKNNVSAFLELLQSGYPVKVIEEPDRFVVTSK